MDRLNKRSAIDEYKDAVAKVDKERERLTELHKRDKNIDIDSLLTVEEKKYNLVKLKEKAFKESRSYSKATIQRGETREK
jgi:hypothetical protein